MPEITRDVVIIGGGVVGATAACALAMQGLRVTIVEARKLESFDAHSDYDLRVSAISPGSELILRALGVWETIESMRAWPYREMHVWDAGGTGEIHFDCYEVNEPRLGYIVENRVIQSALIERMSHMDEVTWRCPAALLGFETTDKGVTVALESGQRIKAHLLVGADGQDSRVRRFAGIGFDARDYHQCALVTTVTTELPHADTAWQRFLNDGVLAFLPLAHGRCSIVWSTRKERARELAAMPEERFRSALADAFDYKLGRVLACSQNAVFPLRGGQAERYVSPRLALIGDAAHNIHPLAGQGANLGLTDAATLAEVLTGTPRDIGSMRRLRRYERARRGDNLAMMLAMEGFKSLFGYQAPPLRWLRNAGLNLTNATAPVKRRIMRHAMGLSGERPRLARGCS
jgi:2-polyprenylphenol 6-hydroxylase